MPAYSTQILSLGTPAPKFSLTNTIDEKTTKLSDFEGRNLLIMFICNHCPYVVRIRDSFKEFSDKYIQEHEIAIVAINANSTRTHPQDGPEEMKKLARELGWNFPYLFDETQEIAKAYKAACTPDFFLFDKNHKLVYRGQYDDARPRNEEPVTGKDLKKAIDALVNENPISEAQIPSAGCSIKWHPNSFPDYKIVSE